MSDDAGAPFLDPMQRMNVQRLARITKMTAAEFDELPVGVIRIDRAGTILAYNAAEGRLAGLDPARVVGKNFFEDVAPCTNVQEFAGRFRDEVGPGTKPVAFPYEFPFPHGNAHVMIVMLWDGELDCGWIFVESTG